MFQVTEDCIRKDLKILENAGKLKRTYGGAILSQDYPLKRDVVDRRQFNLDKKRTIAAKAFKPVSYTHLDVYKRQAQQNGCEGTVYKIEICYTTLISIDNKNIVIPNGTLSGSIITNVTARRCV